MDIPQEVTLPGGANSGQVDALAEAHRLLRQRHSRDHVFGPELFGEPAWDLLLDLYIAASEQRPVSAISASIAAAVSVDEAVGWLTRLEELGLIERLYGGTEMKRAIVALSDTGLNQMTQLLDGDT
jgi:hypothetical protein